MSVTEVVGVRIVSEAVAALAEQRDSFCHGNRFFHNTGSASSSRVWAPNTSDCLWTVPPQKRTPHTHTQLQDERVQHGGGQPRWPPRAPLLRAELLPDRGRGAVRPLGWKRLLQQEDPEKHLPEETEAGHRQERESAGGPGGCHYLYRVIYYNTSG